MDERDRTLPAHELRKVRLKMVDQVRSAGKAGDIDFILAVERKLLENDLDRHANSPAMANSLKTALSDMSIVEKHLALVRDPIAYRVIDEGHSRPKNRVGGVPKDEARQFFHSHATRLLNLDRSRLSPEEKQLLDQRKVNMRAATGLYEGLQRDAMGLPPKEQGRSLDKERGL
jgi:hypothetical protein